MKRLTGSKKVFAVASAVFLVAAASGTALAMIDQGSGSVRGQQVQRQIRQNASGQTQQSPLPTPESHGNEVEFRGTVNVIAATGWVIGGRTVQVTGDTMVEMGIDVGSVVKVHAQRQADGSLIASKIELVQNGGGGDNGNGNSNENENENENHNGDVNSNDNSDNENENENHNGNVNSNDNNDDHGNGNFNDNHGGDHGGNDNHGGDHGGNGHD